MKANKPVGKNVSKLDIGFITVSIISLILSLLDRQNNIIYGEIILFVAFLFFLRKGIYYTKKGNLKYATMCFSFVVVAMASETFKFLMFRGVF